MKNSYTHVLKQFIKAPRDHDADEIRTKLKLFCLQFLCKWISGYWDLPGTHVAVYFNMKLYGEKKKEEMITGEGIKVKEKSVIKDFNIRFI